LLGLISINILQFGVGHCGYTKIAFEPWSLLLKVTFLWVMLELRLGLGLAIGWGELVPTWEEVKSYVVIRVENLGYDRSLA